MTTPDDAAGPLGEFGATFQRFMESVSAHAPAPEQPVFARTLAAHFAADASRLPVLEQAFTNADRPNFQVALDAWTAEPGRTARLVGVAEAHEHAETRLAGLAVGRANRYMPPPVEGPVEHVEVPLAEDRTLACVKRGLFLLADGEARLALLLAPLQGMGPSDGGFRAEVMAADRGLAERFLGEIRAQMRRRNVYRGHVVSLEPEPWGEGVRVRFHHLPEVARRSIVLPKGLLERIERETLGFARHAERLRAAGRHLKRGLLFHGPPGTGKTLTAMHLASRMKDRTVILLTGQGAGMIRSSCAMARALAPSIVILEDVDLVAEERTSPAQRCAPLLFELLNQMDGLAEDTDVLFLLTTNRPDVLEPALAARPGRVDQAIEIPLPDAACRRRLLTLYGRGLAMRLTDVRSVVRRTEGVSAAFMRELLRKAALFAAEAGGDLVVTDRHVDEALHELLVEGGHLTQSLLGARTEARG